MNIQLTTRYQERVLNILRSDGKIVSVWENDKIVNDLCDEQMNVYAIRNDTIKKLESLGFIRERTDCPALGVNMWTITRKGIEWLEVNKVQEYTSPNTLNNPV